jgi:aspartate aminotransferase-like enzyme
MDALLMELDYGTRGSPALLEEIGRRVRRRRDMVLVTDATDVLGRVPVEMDRWGVDAVFAASDGALHLPAGLGLLALSDRLLQRLRNQAGRGTLLDPVVHQVAALHGMPVETVTPILIEALERRLEELLRPPRS